MTIWGSVVDDTESSSLDTEYSSEIIYFIFGFSLTLNIFHTFLLVRNKYVGNIQAEMQNIQSVSRDEYLSFKFQIVLSIA